MGYVGLTLAVTLAKVKPIVFGIDIDQKKVKQLSEGISPIFEPGLNNILRELSRNKAFKVESKLSNEIANSVDTYIICIGTPLDDDTRKPNFKHIEHVVEELSPFLKKNDLVIIRSTVTVGTARNKIIKTLEERTKLKFGTDFFLASAPERTVEGNALKELNELPQIIGSTNEESINKAANIFNKVTKTVIRVSSFEAAEIIKLFDNTSRDVNIALANLFGLICEKLGLNSKEIIECANYGYSRNRIFKAGAGVGGQCLVKDPYFLMASVENQLDLPLLQLARNINDSMPQHMIGLIKEIYKEMKKEIQGSSVLVLGLAFKGTPATDDLRYSPSLPIIEFLKNEKATIFGYDPNVSQESTKGLDIIPAEILKLKDIDCILIMNNNKKYLDIDFEKIKNQSGKTIGLVDGWQLVEPSYLESLGYFYKGVGIGK